MPADHPPRRRMHLPPMAVQLASRYILAMLRRQRRTCRYAPKLVARHNGVTVARTNTSHRWGRQQNTRHDLRVAAARNVTCFLRQRSAFLDIVLLVER